MLRLGNLLGLSSAAVNRLSLSVILTSYRLVLSNRFVLTYEAAHTPPAGHSRLGVGENKIHERHGIVQS